MAKCAGVSRSDSLQTAGACGAGQMLKRKTPSELRGELLKRPNPVECVDESTATLLLCKGAVELGNGLKKPEVRKNTRYIDMRLNELYPVKKSRFRMLHEKEESKQKNGLTEQPVNLKDLSMLSNFVASGKKELSCRDDDSAAKISEDDKIESHHPNESRSGSKLRSVTELSSGPDASTSLATVALDKALKALTSWVPPSSVSPPADSSAESLESGFSCSEVLVSGQKVPLDFTLKTYIHFVSSSEVKWSILCGSRNPMPQSRINSWEEYSSTSSRTMLASEVLDSLAFKSWVHPQSTLPPLLISAITSAVDGAAVDFMTKRQLDWEDSFRSLYFMLRKGTCNIFYVCMSEFVVMFTACCGSGAKKSMCSAYISLSSRSLRTSLKQHDVCFSMPLCNSKVEQATAEDLMELSEIEKQNLGQTCRKSSLSDIDNTPQSLLAFIDTENVHGLYDFLLNYRSSLSSLSSMDVPVLHSPVPFLNAGLFSPVVKCSVMKSFEPIAVPPGESSQSERRYVVDVRDAIIPPWVVSDICNLMGVDGRSFEASFATECSSVGLNDAVQRVYGKTQNKTLGECREDQTCTFGIPGVSASTCLASGHLKGLKYHDGIYTWKLAPL